MSVPSSIQQTKNGFSTVACTAIRCGYTLAAAAAAVAVAAFDKLIFKMKSKRCKRISDNKTGEREMISPVRGCECVCMSFVDKIIATSLEFAKHYSPKTECKLHTQTESGDKERRSIDNFL